MTKWIAIAIIVCIAILALDELAFTWWVNKNPGAMWSGLRDKHPLYDAANPNGTGYPNGYRPAGGH